MSLQTFRRPLAPGRSCRSQAGGAHRLERLAVGVDHFLKSGGCDWTNFAENVYVVSLDELAQDLSLVESLSRDDLIATIPKVAALAASLQAHLTCAMVGVEPTRQLRTSEPDRLLTKAETAAMLNVEESWLDRHTELPFRKKLANGTVRYSLRGIEKHLAKI